MKQSRRYWFTFLTPALVEAPVLWRMSRAFPDVVFDIRQATVKDAHGIMAVMLSGELEQVHAAAQFVRDAGVIVEPIEKSVVEG